MMWKLLSFGCLLGCGGADGVAVDASVVSTPDGAAAPAIEAGTWHYTMYTRSSDTCGNRVEGNDALAIDTATPTSFRVVWPGSVPIASQCTVAATKAFSCTTPTATVDRRPTFDAVISLDVELAGNLTTTTLATGMQRISVGCTGTDCAAANGTPCSVAATIAIARQ